MGLYGITQGKKTSYFTISENIFDPDIKINEVYDLKGSKVGRSQRTESSPLLDRDFKRKLKFGAEQKKKFIDQLKNDSQVSSFVTKVNFLYHLLIFYKVFMFSKFNGLFLIIGNCKSTYNGKKSDKNNQCRTCSWNDLFLSSKQKN